MTATATHLKSHVPVIHIGFVARLSLVFGLMVRTLADFNRCMDAAQRLQGHDRLR